MAAFGDNDDEMRRVLLALGWTLSLIIRNPVEAWFVYIAFRYRPWAAMQFSRLIIGESIKTTGRLAHGTAKIVAPKTTQRIQRRVDAVRRAFSSPLPGWLETGSKYAKLGFVGSVLSTGIGMVALQFDRANRGDYGGDTTMSGFITEADMNMEGDKGYSPTMRPVRIHRMGGPGGLIV